MSTTKDKRFRTYFEVRNVDADDGEMYLEGVSDTGLPNRRGMLLDYETSRPHIVAFVKEFEDRTGGASKGPLRIMHDEDASAAAGKIVNLDLNDDDKTIPVRVHVVDEVAKTKVSASVLNAFSWFWRSVGAPWKDAELTAKHGKPIYRFTGRPVELSLVDSPGVPGTGFTIENADFGLEEDDMDEKDESTKPEGGEEIKNGVYTAGRLMSLLEDLTYVQTAIASEESKEGDSDEIPAELRDAIKALAPVVTKYAAEQIAELVGGEDEDMFVSDDDEFSDIANVADDEGDEIANLDAILNGDYPGHPFRGNQHAKGKGGGRQAAHIIKRPRWRTGPAWRRPAGRAGITSRRSLTRRRRRSTKPRETSGWQRTTRRRKSSTAANRSCAPRLRLFRIPTAVTMLASRIPTARRVPKSSQLSQPRLLPLWT